MTAIETLQDKLSDGSATIGVIGLGYVGLPLAIAAAKAGFRTLGFDIDPEKPAAIAEGRSYLRHIPGAALAETVQDGRLSATTDFARLSEPDVVVICVPTPLTRHREPDLSYLLATARDIAAALRPGQLVVLESTTYPGTTDEAVRPILEETRLMAGRDFLLAFSPEREDPGNVSFTTTTIPKVVGADTPEARAAAEAFYSRIVERVVMVADTRTAETVKLTENIFRAVNIALVNELKLICEPMGVDIWQVIEAASTKPFGYMPFYPGPGLGGHCIPIDPFYLSWKAREYDMTARFIELAGEINQSMPHRVVERLARALDERLGKGLSGARVLVMGVAYKKNVDDMRESPALKLIELMEARGAVVDFHDPFVPRVPRTRDYPGLQGREGVAWKSGLASGYDAALIVTDHDGVDYAGLVSDAPLVVDTRNACRKHGVESEKVVLA